MSAVLMSVALLGALGELAVALWCVAAALPGWRRRLGALGARFLATEVWALVLVTLVHAVAKGAWDESVGGAPRVLVAVAVLGLVLRDLGLWTGPRLPMSGALVARWAVAVGAAMETIGLFGVATLVVKWTVQGRLEPLGAAAPLLLVAAVSALLAAGIGAWWFARLRTPAAYFRWV